MCSTSVLEQQKTNRVSRSIGAIVPNKYWNQQYLSRKLWSRTCPVSVGHTFSNLWGVFPMVEGEHPKWYTSNLNDCICFAGKDSRHSNDCKPFIMWFFLVINIHSWANSDNEIVMHFKAPASSPELAVGASSTEAYQPLCQLFDRWHVVSHERVHLRQIHQWKLSDLLSSMTMLQVEFTKQFS